VANGHYADAVTRPRKPCQDDLAVAAPGLTTPATAANTAARRVLVAAAAPWVQKTRWYLRGRVHANVTGTTPAARRRLDKWAEFSLSGAAKHQYRWRRAGASYGLTAVPLVAAL
jgi:hypothetical protein